MTKLTLLLATAAFVLIGCTEPNPDAPKPSEPATESPETKVPLAQ